MRQHFPFASPPVSTAAAYRIESMIHLIVAGTHIGYVPEGYARPWIEKDKLRPILPDAMGHVVHFYMIIRSDSRTDPIIAAATNLLLAAHAPQNSAPSVTTPESPGP